MSYNLVNPTTGALTKVSGNITSNIIPANASASNKLITQFDVVKRISYSITGTSDAIEDTKALVNHVLTLGSGSYIGEFKRTGITFGSFRLTHFVDGDGDISVSGTVTYSIGNSNDATYQISYLLANGTTYWNIERLSAINSITPDSTAPVMSGTVYNQFVQKAQTTVTDIVSQSAGAYSSLTRRGNLVQCIARFNKEEAFTWSENTKIGAIPQGYRPAVFQPCPAVNFASTTVQNTFVSVGTNGDIYCIPLGADRLDLYVNITWYTEDA